MTVREIRCAQPHPDDPSRPCRGRICDAIEGTVEVVRSDAPPPPGCTAQVCRRCGARYVACARSAA